MEKHNTQALEQFATQYVKTQMDVNPAANVADNVSCWDLAEMLEVEMDLPLQDAIKYSEDNFVRIYKAVHGKDPKKWQTFSTFAAVQAWEQNNK